MGLVCPNVDCRFLKAHGFAPSYRDGTRRCADCGAELVETDAGGAASVAPFSVASAARRGVSTTTAELFTVATLGVFFLLQQVPLPFMDVEVLAGPAPGSLSLLAIGIVPFITAALLVEIAAALVPRWRALRRPSGRATLTRATNVVGLLVAMMQATMLVSWVASMNVGDRSLFTNDGALARVAIIATIIGGAVLCRLGAQLIDARGIGSGISLLVAAPLAVQLVSSLAEVPVLVHAGSISGATVVLGLLVLAGAATVAAIYVRPLPDDGSLPLPIAGVVPLVWAAPLAIWHWALVPLGALMLTPLLGRVLHVRRAGFTAALPLSLLCVAAWAGLDVVSQRSLPLGALLPGVVSIVVIVTVLRDVIAELSFAHDHGALARVGVVPSLAAAQRVQARLASLGIAAHVRAAHHRALLHFFGPHLELEVLVARVHGERAQVLMRNGLIDDELRATAAAPAPPSSPPAAAPLA